MPLHSVYIANDRSQYETMNATDLHGLYGETVFPASNEDAQRKRRYTSNLLSLYSNVYNVRQQTFGVVNGLFRNECIILENFHIIKTFFNV